MSAFICVPSRSSSLCLSIALSLSLSLSLGLSLTVSHVFRHSLSVISISRLVIWMTKGMTVFVSGNGRPAKNCYKDGWRERERERERAVIVRGGNTNYSLTLTNPFISNDWNKSSSLIQHFNGTNNLQSDNSALNTGHSLH